MPDGSVSHELHYYELKSLPPDGFVRIRQLPYYDMLLRRDKGSVASMESEVGGRRKRNEVQTAKMTIESLQTWEREYMFRECIAEHNITDKNGTLFDFKNPMTLKMLNPKIGAEIERYIDEVNSEDEEFAETFPNAASSSSEQVEPVHSIHESTDSQTS